jgi:hypothetical protein
MNFYKYFIEEESFDYYDLYKIGEENFNSWFKENSIHFTIKTKKEILPSDELLIELTNKTYCPKKSQCHYNSQLACLLHDKLVLCTGLLIKCDNEFYTHSFCLLNNEVVDFSANFFLEEDKLGFNDNKFPFEYFGIKIDRVFLKANEKEILENGYSTKPYLIEWYFATNPQFTL